jgi:hypothetical protein
MTEEVKTAFDKPDQLERIKAYVLKDEVLYAVYDCKGAGTGFVGVTDRRIIFYDQGMFLNKSKKMISIPYNRIIGVASADEGVIFKSSEITLLTAAGNFSFEFRGTDKAVWVYGHILRQILASATPQTPD